MTKPNAKEVRKLRLEYGLTQAACAKAMRVTTRQWRRYEGGENEMMWSTWILFQHREIWPKESDS